jgi:hypothetical protein
MKNSKEIIEDLVETLYHIQINTQDENAREAIEKKLKDLNLKPKD